MKIAWNEITYQPKKFVLIEILIALLMFMVVFLSGLTNGLGRSVSAQIDNFGPLNYILSKDSDKNIPFSSITPEDTEEIEKIDGIAYSGLFIQRATIAQTEGSSTLDITYFAIENNGQEILTPKTSGTGARISDLKENEVILDSSFQDEGIQLGDEVIDKASKQKLTVIAFAQDAKYGYSEIGFVNSETYTGMRRKADPNFQWRAQTLVTPDSVTSSDLTGDLVVADREQHLAQISEQSSGDDWIILLVVVVLGGYAGVSAINALVGSTMARRRELALLRLAGARRGQVVAAVVVESMIVAVTAVVAGTVVAALTMVSYGHLLTGTVWLPFVAPAYAGVVGSALLAAAIGSLAPARVAVRADPLEAMR